MKKLFTLLVWACSSAAFAQLNIDISTLGAQGNGSTDNTAYIQTAVDSMSAAGGGEVIISGGGTYMSSTIVLKSDVTLRITPGTKLMGKPNYNDYPDHPYDIPSWSDTYTKRSLIFAENAHNIRITGGGTIDGNGTQLGYLNVSVKSRPFGLRIHHIDTLVIDSITLRQAPQWMGHIAGCTQVHINAVTVYNQCYGSNDGFDIDCCQGVLLENSTFDTNDDPCPIKTHSRSVCRDILVRNCTLATFERAVKVGNETLGPIVNVRFEDITVVPSSNVVVGSVVAPYNAIYVSVADGGSIDSVYLERINVQATSQTSIFIRLCDRGNTFDSVRPGVNYVRNIWLRDISATQTTTIPSSITGIPGYPVQNVHFNNISVTVPGGGPPGSVNIPEQLSTRPEFNIFGDSLPAYGLYVRHAEGISLDSFCVTTQQYDQRPLYHFEDTASVIHINDCYANMQPNGIASTAPDATLSIYPNPASSALHIDHVPAACEAILVYDAAGAEVMMIPVLHRTDITTDISTLAPGIYQATGRGVNYISNNTVTIVR